MKQKSFWNFTTLVFIMALLIPGCSSDKTKEAGKEANPEAGPKAEGAGAAGGCCFTKMEDFAPFFPSGNELLTIHGSSDLAASFYCGADEDNKRSTASRQYQIDKKGTKDPMLAKYISLQIYERCSNPKELAEEITRRTTNAEKAATQNPKITVKRIEKQGVYTGYTWMDSSPGNNASNVELFVAVDSRFLIHIQGVDHNRMDALQQLFEMIPVEQLAAL